MADHSRRPSATSWATTTTGTPLLRPRAATTVTADPCSACGSSAGPPVTSELALRGERVESGELGEELGTGAQSRAEQREGEREAPTGARSRERRRSPGGTGPQDAADLVDGMAEGALELLGGAGGDRGGEERGREAEARAGAVEPEERVLRVDGDLELEPGEPRHEAGPALQMSLAQPAERETAGAQRIRTGLVAVRPRGPAGTR